MHLKVKDNVEKREVAEWLLSLGYLYIGETDIKEAEKWFDENSPFLAVYNKNDFSGVKLSTLWVTRSEEGVLPLCYFDFINKEATRCV